MEPEYERRIHEALIHSFLHFYHLDHSNAAVHTATVRYSPITFRLAEVLGQYPWLPRSVAGVHSMDKVQDVLEDRGLYEEDPGR